MGNFASNYPKAQEKADDDNNDGLRTPNSSGPLSKRLMELLDPRSPTVGVSRTPVEVTAERERERHRRMQALSALSQNEAPPPATTPTAFFDPRSPTFEYKRTPIALNSQSEAEPMDQKETSGKNDNELQIPVPQHFAIRGDLRKRLFVSQFNDSLNASGIQDENKEN